MTGDTVDSTYRVLHNLFTPARIGNIQLKNRIIMPPMIDRLAADGMVTERVKDFYSARARGGVALIVLTPGIVNVSMKSDIQLGIYDDSFVPSLRGLTEVIHSNGALIGIELMHLGRQGEGIAGYELVAPSPIPWSPREKIPRELTTGEVEDIVGRFADAARRAREAGFDMVELHACHGYLLSSFLSPHTNKREDKYGGGVEERARFIVEIVERVKEKAGDDFPVSCRINGADYLPGGVTVEVARQTAQILEKAGADLIGVSSGAYGSYPVIVPPYDQPKGCNVHLAEAIKEVLSIPVAVAGRLDDPWVAEDVLASGKADLIAIGRGLLADPDLPNKALRGEFREIRRCIACNVCIDLEGTKPITCTVNPEAGREREMQIAPASQPKRTLVIGGGLAGLEAANAAAQRGHRVILYEEDEEVGGQWLLAAKPPKKQNHIELLAYLSWQLEKLGVERHLGERITAQTVEELRPDVLIIATGALPLVPSIPGVEHKEVTTAWDVLRGSEVGGQVLVVGGGMAGLETAEFLVHQGKNVLLVEQLGRVGADMGETIRWHLMNRLKGKKIEILTSTRIREIRSGGKVVVWRDEREETLEGFDTIVLACGVVARDEILKEIDGKGREVYVIGDAAKPRKGRDAIREGAEVGRQV